MARRDLIVIGGGTAGLVAAVGAAGQGARVTLVERERTGGDCLWTGCVPSKSLLAAASAAHAARSSSHLGVHTTDVEVAFDEVMAHVHGAIAAIAPHDSPERLEREGVDLVHGHARFVGGDAVEVDGRRLRFHHAMLATGAAPVVPPIPGLAAADPLTTETIWGLTSLPERLVILGGGPIGCELGQAFARLGSQVTLVEMAPRLLPREEPEASAVIHAALVADGVDVRTGARAAAVEDAADGGHIVALERDGTRDHVTADRILVAVGRRPRTDDLGLEVADIEVDAAGAVVVDDRLRTTNTRVYAGGDVTALLPFTHVAAAHGATVVQNALFGLRARVDHDRIPWVTFTSPEVARLGPSVDEARERYGPGIQVRRHEHAEVDRARAEGRTEGFALLVGDDKGRLIGGTVVGPHAGETIGEVVAWRQQDAKLSAIARSSTHAYPTWSDDIAAASLAQLRVDLRKLRPASAILLRWRRLLRR